MSSSTSAQWMPAPLPTRRQFWRSAREAAARRGYQSIGTDRTRPSMRCTVNESSLTSTCAAKGLRASIGKVVIPGVQQCVGVRVNYSRNSTEFHGREAAAFLQPHRQKPKLGNARISLDMNMRRFAGITRVEEEAVRPA